MKKVEIFVNGKRQILDCDISVSEFLVKNGYKLEFVAVERDGEILSRNLWQEHMMSEAKVYEIVEFVGGG